LLIRNTYNRQGKEKSKLMQAQQIRSVCPKRNRNGCQVAAEKEENGGIS
jgi:hypothetical protein